MIPALTWMAWVVDARIPPFIPKAIRCAETFPTMESPSRMIKCFGKLMFRAFVLNIVRYRYPKVPSPTGHLDRSNTAVDQVISASNGPDEKFHRSIERSRKRQDQCDLLFTTSCLVNRLSAWRIRTTYVPSAMPPRSSIFTTAVDVYEATVLPCISTSSTSANWSVGKMS